MKKLSIIFGLLAVLLSDIMCIVVTYNYCALGGVRYYLSAVPAYFAFVWVIPYAIGIIICIVLAFRFQRKHHAHVDVSSLS